MIDSSKPPSAALSEEDRDNLISRIDELEQLLARKKAEAQQANLPRLKFGTDGIPVLIDTVTEDDINPDKGKTLDKDDQIINNIIDKVDKEITDDLDELVLMLKDSIIDEVKTRLLEELHTNENKSGNKQNNE